MKIFSIKSICVKSMLLFSFISPSYCLADVMTVEGSEIGRWFDTTSPLTTTWIQQSTQSFSESPISVVYDSNKKIFKMYQYDDEILSSKNEIFIRNYADFLGNGTVYVVELVSSGQGQSCTKEPVIVSVRGEVKVSSASKVIPCDSAFILRTAGPRGHEEMQIEYPDQSIKWIYKLSAGGESLELTESKK